MINSVVCANGVYDIVCAIAIMFFPDTSIGRLHVDVFVAPMDAITRRILAYWVLTYGVIRMAAVLHHQTVDRVIVTTYLLEAVVFAVETLVFNSTHRCRAAWIVGTCMLLYQTLNPDTLTDAPF
jgi:hypothetical protein